MWKRLHFWKLNFISTPIFASKYYTIKVIKNDWKDGNVMENLWFNSSNLSILLVCNVLVQRQGKKTNKLAGFKVLMHCIISLVSTWCWEFIPCVDKDCIWAIHVNELLLLCLFISACMKPFQFILPKESVASLYDILWVLWKVLWTSQFTNIKK